MDETTFEVWRVDGVDVVRAIGVLDFAATIRLRLTLFGRLDAGARHLVVDLSRVRLLDASAVNVLLRVRERLLDTGGSLAAPGATGLVLEVLEIAGAAKKLGAYEPMDPRLADPSADAAGPVSTAPGGAHGQWGDRINELMGRLHALPAGDPARTALRDELVRDCLPFVERLARRFYGLGESSADLNQVAALGLLKAVDRYDPNLGTDFPSYATPTIVGELKRHFRDRGWAVRVPRRLQELRLDINRARAEMTHELNRSPTVAELAERLTVDHDQIIEALTAAGGYRATSLFAPVAADDTGRTLLDSLGAEDAALDAVESHESLQPLLAALPQRERDIITMRFFGNMTQGQIAERLGISQMHVSRLLARTLVRLRECLLATD
jgi:RNA polymerase sigma-B factor